MRMTPEQQDAAILAMRLASNPVVTARRTAFWAAVAANMTGMGDLSKEDLIAILTVRNPAYIERLLQEHEVRDLLDRVVMSMQGKDRPLWEQAIAEQREKPSDVVRVAP